MREGDATLLHRRDDALIALLDCSIRQTDDGKLHASFDHHFDGDNIGVNTLNSSRIDL